MSIKIISWDIGIINLSYCLIEYLNEKANIIEWNIIDIIKNYECKYCNKNISKHKIISNIVFKNSIIKNNNCNITNCNNNIKYNYCKYYFCELHKSNIKKIKKKNNCNKFNINLLKKFLIQNLENNINVFTNIDIVLIENQPALMNPIIKTLSETLYSWFMIRNIIDLKKEIIINMVSPLSKLSIYDKMKKFDELRKNIDLNNKSNRKKLGINFCNLLFENNKYYKDYISLYNKKDDLCDCLLYIIRYLVDNIKLKNKEKINIHNLFKMNHLNFHNKKL